MKSKVIKTLRSINQKHSGRNNSGKITVRHQGGRQKRYLRLIDWKRLTTVPGKVTSIEYDPNRTADVALITYTNGLKSYILAPAGLNIGDTIQSGDQVEFKVGNCTQIRNIPIGMAIHNLEIVPGKGAQMVRSAGNSATVQSKEETQVIVKLPSGELRIFKPECKAVIGALTNEHHKEEIIGKAGRARHMGRRPTVRGVAQDPRSHPHGGGEGRSGIGLKSPKSVYGKRVMGVRTRGRKKYSNSVIIKRRNQK